MTLLVRVFIFNHMKSLTHSQLINGLKHSKGLAIVGLLTLTDTKAKKTGNPFALPILKTVRTIGYVGANYEKAVNREANRQGETPAFEAESLPWGSWLIPGKVIEHNGQFYLRTQTTPGNRRKMPAKVLGYQDAKGNPVTYQEIKQFLPIARESNKQQEETGIQQTVWVRTYAFNSILKIRISGETYKLIPG